MIFNASLFRKLDFLTANGYNVNMKKGLEDWDFLLSLLKPTDTVYQIPETLFFYRIREDSRTEFAGKHDIELKRQIYRNHPDRFKDDVIDIINYHDQLLVLNQITTSRLYILWKLISSPIKTFIKRAKNEVNYKFE